MGKKDREREESLFERFPTAKAYAEQIRPLLSEYRYRHSINVAFEAVILAEKYGADPKKAAEAGVLHDCMKDSSPAEQLTLIEKAQQAVTEEDAKKMQQKLRENSFTLEDYLEQFESMKKMGGLQSVMSMLPGMGGKLKDADLDESKMERTKAIILSMTKKEREDPVIINASRKRRIAAGSGTSVQEINQLLKQFDQVKTLMKQLKSGKRRLPF